MQKKRSYYDGSLASPLLVTHLVMQHYARWPKKSERDACATLTTNPAFMSNIYPSARTGLNASYVGILNCQVYKTLQKVSGHLREINHANHANQRITSQPRS